MATTPFAAPHPGEGSSSTSGGSTQSSSLTKENQTSLVVASDPYWEDEESREAQQQDQGGGSPSKQRRKRPHRWDGPDETTAKRPTRKRCCLIVLVFLITVGGVGILAYFILGRVLIAGGNANDRNGPSNVAESAINYTQCRMGWEDTSFLAIDGLDDESEIPCSGFNNEYSCNGAISCCWTKARSQCETYRKRPECGTMETKEECEAGES